MCSAMFRFYLTCYRKYCSPKIVLGVVSFLIVLQVFIYVFIYGHSRVIYISLDDVPLHLVSVELNVTAMNISKIPACEMAPVPADPSLMVPKQDITDSELLSIAKLLHVSPGGSWKPDFCVPRHRVAIIIPYRNRKPHLNVFLGYMHKFLQAQLIDYRIFIVEQNNRRPFNRAKLFNIGFIEAETISKFPCYIFHDVDLIPQNLNNIYGCTGLPRHMSAYIDIFDYKVPYDTIIGGAVAILKDQFQAINGFSNTFFGWGGEDDDFYNRVTMNGSKICRFTNDVAQYVMLSHKKEKPNADRYFILNTGSQRFKTDGLNSLEYTLVSREELPMYTRILVDL